MASNLDLAAHPPLHSKRIEAWIYAILNPLVEGLRREISLLGKGNLSWQLHSKKCEYIRPIVEYVGYEQRPNYEDFVADPLNLGFREKFTEHDRVLAEVESRASRFADGLMHSNLFLEQVRDSMTEYESALRAGESHLALSSTVEALSRGVAELLVNRIEVLPNHYGIHKFWETHGHKFWEQLGQNFDPPFERQFFGSLRQAVGELEGVSKELLVRLEDHRQSLCRTYDIPAAPIPMNRSHGADASIV